MIYILIPTTKERRPRLEKLIESLRVQEFAPAFTVCIHENSSGGCVKPTHEMLEGINGLVWILNDDMVVSSEAIANLAIDYAAAFPDNDGLCSPADDIHHGRLCVAPFCHSDVLKRYYHKGYTHNYGDTELTEVMKARKKFLIVPDARVAHEHPINGKAEVDETYKSSQATYSQDEELFNQRRALGFPQE